MSGGDFQFKFGFDFGQAEGDLRRFVELVRSETSKLVSSGAAANTTAAETGAAGFSLAQEKAQSQGINVTKEEEAALAEFAQATASAATQTRVLFDQLKAAVEKEKFLADAFDEYATVVTELTTLSSQRRAALARELGVSDEYIQSLVDLRTATVTQTGAVRAGSEVQLALDDEARSQLIAQNALSKALYKSRSDAATGGAAQITTDNPDMVAERGTSRAQVDQANADIKLFAAMQKLSDVYDGNAVGAQRIADLQNASLSSAEKLNIAQDLLAQAYKDRSSGVRDQVGLSKPQASDGSGGGGGLGGLLAGGISTAIGFAEAQAGFAVIQQLQTAAQEALNFQDAMVKVNVVLQQTGQGSALSSVQTSLIDISQTAGVAASSLAAPFLQAQGAFGGAAEGLKAVSDATQLAKLSGQDLATTMQQLVVIASSFGVTASNLGQINDVVFGAFERYGTPVKDITTALKGLADTGDTVGFSLTFLTDIIAKAAQLSGQSATTESGLVSRALTALPTNEGKVLQFSDANNLGINTGTFDKGMQAVLTAAGQAIDSGKLSSEKTLELAGLLAGNPRVAPAFLPVLQSAGTAANDQGINDAGKAQAAFNAQMNDTKEGFNRLKTSLTDLVVVGLLPVIDVLNGVLSPLDALIHGLVTLASIKIPITHLRVPGTNVQIPDVHLPKVHSATYIPGTGIKLWGPENTPPPLSSGQSGADKTNQTRQQYIDSQRAQLTGLEDDASLNAKQVQAIKDALADPGNKAKFEAVLKIMNDAGKTPAGVAAIKSGIDAAAAAAAANAGDITNLQGLYDAGEGTRTALEAAYQSNIAFNQGIVDDLKSSTAARDQAAKNIASSQKAYNTLIQEAGKELEDQSQIDFVTSGLDRSPIDKALNAVNVAKQKVETASQEVGPNAKKDLLAAQLAEDQAFNAYAQLQITEADDLALALDDLAASTATSPAAIAAAKLKHDQDALTALVNNPTGDPLVDQKNQAEAQAKVNADNVANAARNRTEANTAQDAGFNLQAAQAGKDPVAVAQAAQAKANADLARAQAETGLVDAATQQADVTNAQAAQVKAAQALKDAYNQIDTANLTLQSAIDAADPVKAAQDAIAAANLAASQAQGVAAQTSAAAAQVKANRDLQNAILAVFTSQFDLMIAVDNAAGDTVKAAQDGLSKVNSALASAPSRGINPGSAAYNQLLAQQATAQAGVRDAQLNDKQTNIQNELTLKEITNAQAIVLYQQLLAIPNLTEKERQDIQIKIQGLKGSVGNLNFDIPTDIALPTLYSVRRLNQTPSGQTYGGTSIDNSQKNFNFYVTGANLSQVQDMVAAAIGSTAGVYGTGYRRV